MDRILKLQITSATGLPPGATLDVHIEHDDGWVSYATLQDPYGERYRCYVNTAERRAHWEARPWGG